MGSNGGDETIHEGWGKTCKNANTKDSNKSRYDVLDVFAVVVGEDSGDEFQVQSGDGVVLVGLRKHHQLNGARA